jgi:hypothetical protein
MLSQHGSIIDGVSWWNGSERVKVGNGSTLVLGRKTETLGINQG